MTARSIRCRAADSPVVLPPYSRALARGKEVALMTFVLLTCQLAHASSPHPAVARIIVHERSATSYGSGTLIDVREQYGLVITNWHVVRDATGPPEVVFPNGFRSTARPLKLDSNWDLAALVIWRPPIEPVAISQLPPRPGDPLMICGYGQGEYRVAAGRCTQYYAPRVDYPHELLELDVEARQGDSGGPIFNAQGELAGVLFGTGQGTTMGSYGGRVHAFLASIAPDIGQNLPQQIAQVPPPSVRGAFAGNAQVAPSPPPQQHDTPASLLPPQSVAASQRPDNRVDRQDLDSNWEYEHFAPTDTWESPLQAVTSATASVAPGNSGLVESSDILPLASLASSPPLTERLARSDVAGRSWMTQFTTVLAVIGAIAVVLQLAKLASR